MLSVASTCSPPASMDSCVHARAPYAARLHVYGACSRRARQTPYTSSPSTHLQAAHQSGQLRVA